MKTDFENSIILITGGSGSWGQELTKQLISNYSPKEIRIYSRGEQKQVEMKRSFSKYKNIKYIIGDVRDKQQLQRHTKEVDYIFHLAALKHVPVCEENPWEAVQTNVIGIQNIIDASIENKIKKVIYITTDKAVNPINLYGFTKACGEKLMTAANQLSSTKFVCVRGGNVLGTNGSVVPLFKEQIKRINQISLTDQKMTRFIMKVEDAIKLALKAAKESIGGEIFVLKTPSIFITDLAKVMIDSLGNKNTKIIITGIRPGEKISEVLISKNEISRTTSSGSYYIILPQIKTANTFEHYQKKSFSVLTDEYSSENTTILNKREIKKMLMKDGWLDPNIKQETTILLDKISDDNLKNIPKSEGWRHVLQTQK